MSDPVKKGQKFQNREAFKAHRNIKRAVRDVDKENALKSKACQGVCRRCVQKVCTMQMARAPTTQRTRARRGTGPVRWSRPATSTRHALPGGEIPPLFITIFLFSSDARNPPLSPYPRVRFVGLPRCNGDSSTTSTRGFGQGQYTAIQCSPSFRTLSFYEGFTWARLDPSCGDLIG